MPAGPQQQDKWRQKRVGRLTGSNFGKIYSAKGIQTQTCLSYLYEKLGEHIEKRPPFEVSTAPIRWGKRWEGDAHTAYTTFTGLRVKAQDYFPHPSEPLVGCSPDGFIKVEGLLEVLENEIDDKPFLEVLRWGDDGLLEMKCPYTPTEHARALWERIVPKQHHIQLQGNLWVTGKDWGHYLSFNPRATRLVDAVVVIPVRRDEKLIAKIRDQVLDARDELVRMLRERGIEIYEYRDGDEERYADEYELWKNRKV